MQVSVNESDKVARPLLCGGLDWAADIAVYDLQLTVRLRSWSSMGDRVLLFLLDAGQTLRESLALHVNVELTCNDVEVLLACMAETMM